MHTNSMMLMEKFAKRLEPEMPADVLVLDCGAGIAPGQSDRYREMVEQRGWDYDGLDATAGPNIDIVANLDHPVESLQGLYDLVISGQLLEHTRRPWKVVEHMAAFLKPGGWMVLIAPWSHKVHGYPIDCWRILPPGMEAIMKDAGLDKIETDISEKDCWGMGRKP